MVGVTNHPEGRRVRAQPRHRDGRRAGVAGVGDIVHVRDEVGGRHFQEVSLEFQLAVFLSSEVPVFCDCAAIAVGRVAEGMAQVAPVCSAVDLQN